MWKFDDLASVLVEDGVVRTWADFVGVSSDDLLTDAQFLRCHGVLSFFFTRLRALTNQIIHDILKTFLVSFPGQEYYTGFVEDTLPPTLSRRIGFTQARRRI